MNIKYQYIRQSRIVEEAFDPKLAVAAMSDNQESNMNVIANTEMPITFIVKVQVKVCIVWITIWKKRCDISDGDTRAHIINEATKIQQSLEGKD